LNASLARECYDKVTSDLVSWKSFGPPLRLRVAGAAVDLNVDATVGGLWAP